MAKVNKTSKNHYPSSIKSIELNNCANINNSCASITKIY